MAYLSQLCFSILSIIGILFFVKSITKIRRNIFLGKKENLSDQKAIRLKTMALVALGQKKMFTRPLAAFFHILIYVGFVLINIEVLEIFLDGILGKHRLFQPYLGSFYGIVIGFFEILAFAVLFSCVFFLIRRVFKLISRLNHTDLKGFAQKDATLILIIEIVLMSALLLMNAVDFELQSNYNLPISSIMSNWFYVFDESSLHIIERFFWWTHWVGILLFLNYLPYSKHFHIIMAFPNTYYSKLSPKGQFANNAAITTEVKLMLDPNATMPENYEPPTSFGIKDVKDLSWKNLMDAYTCTECGRCTSVCPANITGKLLSPRKIIMNVRDRLEEVGKNIDQHGIEFQDQKDLFNYTSAEELWACTSCNACVEACPVNINPLEVIIGMRQYLVMEKTEAPSELNTMFSNLENNGAPWQFNAMDKSNWANEL